eukprot:TRINITY_DN14513_c0_g1_i1.p1 TRINITY_DN14513_c0_g1~~TRINITY_DN14513_c0_g1_i1.p1  ORF type:complete len:402 (-),score=88.75 TRINITY_DN14513_c0_g1_i1:161-1366(-)
MNESTTSLPLTTSINPPGPPPPSDNEGNETLNIVLAVSISVTLTLLLFLVLMFVFLYRKRFSCLLCSVSKSSKTPMGSMDDINISTIGRYYDILRSPIRKFSISVLSDRKSSNASRKLSESSQIPESNELPRRNHVQYLNNHLCPPLQNYSPRSLGEDDIKSYDEGPSKRFEEHIVIPNISLESEVDRYSPRLDHLRLLNHSAPAPVYKQRLDVDEESVGSPFSRSPRLDDREAIFGKPEIHHPSFEEEIRNMRDIDESSDDIIDENSYTDVKRHHFGQSLEALSPSLPNKSKNRNSYDPRDEAPKDNLNLHTSHYHFHSEGWLLNSPSVPPKIAPRLPPKQAINKSKNEIQIITKELENSTLALKTLDKKGEYEDYDDPPSLSNDEFEDYDIPVSRAIED